MLNVLLELKILQTFLLILIINLLVEIIFKYIYKSKFILTTKIIFVVSFCLFISIFVPILLEYLIFGFDSSINYSIFTYISQQYGLISVGFYFLMPITRFIFNFRKIETEEEKKSVSGFYVRYFGGILMTFLIIILFLDFFTIGTPDTSTTLFSIFLIFLFYIISIYTIIEPEKTININGKKD